MDDKTTLQARVCKENYDLSLHAVLESGQWPFATVEASLKQLKYEPYSIQQKFVYEIPNDCALILSITKRWSRKQMRRGMDWDLRYIPDLNKTCIICNLDNKVYPSEAEQPPLPDLDNNLDPVWPEGAVNSVEPPVNEPIGLEPEDIMIEYIADNGNTSSYTALFVKCVVAQLAADICMPITHDMNKYQMLLQLANATQQKALVNALNEDGKDKMFWIDPITNSRGW